MAGKKKQSVGIPENPDDHSIRRILECMDADVKEVRFVRAKDNHGGGGYTEALRVKLFFRDHTYRGTVSDFMKRLHDAE